jgi:hypothetical protein
MELLQPPGFGNLWRLKINGRRSLTKDRRRSLPVVTLRPTLKFPDHPMARRSSSAEKERDGGHPGCPPAARPLADALIGAKFSDKNPADYIHKRPFIKPQPIAAEKWRRHRRAPLTYVSGMPKAPPVKPFSPLARRGLSETERRFRCPCNRAAIDRPSVRPRATRQEARPSCRAGTG